MTIDLDRERRAWALLRWGDDVIHPDAPFNPHLAGQGWYSRAQKKRSDAALDDWDEQHPYVESPELAAFRSLESMGVFADADYYSSLKARERFCTKRLREYISSTRASSENTGKGRGTRQASRYLRD